MKRGFTLIELLVVISIMGMLSSIVLASVASARMKGRDGLRISQLHQIDLAIQLYMSSNGNKAPTLQNSCPATASPDASTVSGCVANATTNPTGWSRLKADLAPYMATVPNDPCFSGACTSAASGYPLGYTYVAPAAVKYQCAQDSGGTCPQSTTILSQYYQLYAPLERNSMPAGVKSLGSSFFTPPSPGGYGF